MELAARQRTRQGQRRKDWQGLDMTLTPPSATGSYGTNRLSGTNTPQEGIPALVIHLGLEGRLWKPSKHVPSPHSVCVVQVDTDSGHA